MNKSFSLEYNGLIFTFLKKNITFHNGYGIVFADNNSDPNYSYPLIGVVDEDFKEVVPLTSSEMMPKLAIVPNGTFLYKYYDMISRGFKVWHGNSDGSAVCLGAIDIEAIDNGIFKLIFCDGEALYDAISCNYFTGRLTKIGPFIDSEKYNQKVARVSFILLRNSSEFIDDIAGVISVNGDFLEPLVSLKTGKIFESTNLDDIKEEILGNKSRS